MITYEKQSPMIERIARVGRVQDVIATIFVETMNILMGLAFLGGVAGSIFYVDYMGRTLLERNYLGKCVSVAGVIGTVTEVKTVEPHIDRDYLPSFTGLLMVEATGQGHPYPSRAVKLVPCGP